MATSVHGKRSMHVFAFALALLLPLALLLASPVHAHAEEGDLIAGCNHVWTYDDNESYAATYADKGLRVWYCDNCWAERTKVIPKKKKTKAVKRASKPIVKFYKYAKKYNVGKMSRCFKKKPKNAFFVKKRYLADMCKKQNKKRLKCRLIDGEVRGKRAWFEVEVKYRSGYGAFYDAFFAYYKAGVKYAYRNLETPSDSWMEAELKKQITRHVRSVGYYKETKTFKISVVKTKKGWRIARATRAIKDSVNCDYDTADEDAYNDYIA